MKFICLNTEYYILDDWLCISETMKIKNEKTKIWFRYLALENAWNKIGITDRWSRWITLDFLKFFFCQISNHYKIRKSMQSFSLFHSSKKASVSCIQVFFVYFSCFFNSCWMVGKKFFVRFFYFVAPKWKIAFFYHFNLCPTMLLFSTLLTKWMNNFIQQTIFIWIRVFCCYHHHHHHNHLLGKFGQQTENFFSVPYKFCFSFY